MAIIMTIIVPMIFRWISYDFPKLLEETKVGKLLLQYENRKASWTLPKSNHFYVILKDGKLLGLRSHNFKGSVNPLVAKCPTVWSLPTFQLLMEVERAFFQWIMIVGIWGLRLLTHEIENGEVWTPIIRESIRSTTPHSPHGRVLGMSHDKSPPRQNLLWSMMHNKSLWRRLGMTWCRRNSISLVEFGKTSGPPHNIAG